MVQRKLDYYSQRSIRLKSPTPLPSQCAPSFLDLPYQIRHRIYLLVGLVRFCPIDLNQEGPRVRHYLRNGDEYLNYISRYLCYFESRKFKGKDWRIETRPDCHCPPLPFSLLYICHAISEEVSRVLYSENSFIICRSDSWGLKPLRNLNSSALSCLRVLSVRLNKCDCLFQEEFRTLRHAPESKCQGLMSCHPLCKSSGFHDHPLRSRARQHAIILHEWQDIVNKLAVHCSLESLRLDLVCDTQDMETAYDVVKRLSPIQNLGACSIRLSQNPSWQHSVVARQTAYRLVDSVPEPILGHKPIKYHLPPEILSHILAYSELIAPFDLEWRPDRGLVPFDCCKKCTATLDFCTCPFYHGAYSRSCTCWRLPLSIFLVSRQVYAISKTIFFQRNRFIILPKGGQMDNLRSCQVGFPGFADFLTRLPPNTAPLLRSVGLLISLRVLNGEVYDKLVEEWANVIKLLISRCDTKSLMLAVFMGYGWYRTPRSEVMLHYAYQKFANYLGDIDNLKDLFIYLQWPYDSATDHAVQYSSELEKKALGSDYDSKARGKWDHPPRLWYNGESREDPVFAADGRMVWSRWPVEDAYGPPRVPLITYV